MEMSLMRAGLIYHHPGSKPVPRQPRSLARLLMFWQLTVDRIEDGYTLGDLIELLRGVRRIDVLSGMTACDIVELLEEAALGPLPRSGDAATVRQLRVRTRLEPETYVEHPDDTEDEWLDPAKGRMEITLGERHGFWTGPYRIYRDLLAWGETGEPGGGLGENGFPVELAGVRRLLDLPLRYVPDTIFSHSIVRESGFETAISITFGEFVTAVLRTVGRFGSEEERREVLESMLPEPDEEGDEEGGAGASGETEVG